MTAKTERLVYESENDALKRLSNNGIHANTSRILEIQKGRSVGIALWGAIDFLKKFGFSWRRLSR